MVRHFGWNELDVYRFYNVSHPDYPNLPPPPNPSGLTLFMFACIELSLEQMAKENGDRTAGSRKAAGPTPKAGARPRFR